MSRAFQYRPKFVDIRVRPPKPEEEEAAEHDVTRLKPGEKRDALVLFDQDPYELTIHAARYEGIRRDFTMDDVKRLSGSVKIEYTLAELGARIELRGDDPVPAGAAGRGAVPPGAQCLRPRRLCAGPDGSGRHGLPPRQAAVRGLSADDMVRRPCVRPSGALAAEDEKEALGLVALVEQRSARRQALEVGRGAHLLQRRLR